MTEKSPASETPLSRSRKALEGVDIRRLLEASGLPVEQATAIADMCEGLLSEIGAWHPVSEQPKNEDAMFIVRDKDGQAAFAVRYEGKWEHVADDDCGEIAHWTPLPEAPK